MLILASGVLVCATQMWQLSSLWWRVAATTWWSEKTIRPTDYRKPSTFSRTFGTTGQFGVLHQTWNQRHFSVSVQCISRCGDEKGEIKGFQKMRVALKSTCRVYTVVSVQTNTHASLPCNLKGRNNPTFPFRFQHQYSPSVQEGFQCPP